MEFVIEHKLTRNKCVGIYPREETWRKEYQSEGKQNYHKNAVDFLAREIK